MTSVLFVTHVRGSIGVSTSRHAKWCGQRCPSAFNSFELPSWMLYQDVQLLWDSGLVRGESGYSL
jgi:hypothetical protein